MNHNSKTHICSTRKITEKNSKLEFRNSGGIKMGREKHISLLINFLLTQPLMLEDKAISMEKALK